MNPSAKNQQVLAIMISRCLVGTFSIFLVSSQMSRALAAVNLTTLLAFNNTNGAYPSCVMIQGADGYFYGTALNGGTDNINTGYGTVFKITSNGTLAWTVSFNRTNGENPYAGLLQGADGNM